MVPSVLPYPPPPGVSIVSVTLHEQLTNDNVVSCRHATFIVAAERHKLDPAVRHLALPIVLATGTGCSACHAIRSDSAALRQDSDVNFTRKFDITDTTVSAAILACAARTIPL